MSMPLVFTSTERIVPAQEWSFHLSRNASAYRNCFVRRITHVKNLNSSVLHEYLQNRTRVLAERQVNQDQVIIGRWSFGPSHKFGLTSSYGLGDSWEPLQSLPQEFSSSSSSSSAGILPLQLWSLTFQENVLNVIHLAEVIRITSQRLGSYHMVTRNCYIFAKGVYTAIMQRYGCQQTRWRFYYLQGTIPFGVIISQSMKNTAAGFDVQNQNGFEYMHGRKFQRTLDLSPTAAAGETLHDDIDKTDEEREEVLTYCKLRDLAGSSTEGSLAGATADVNDLDESFKDLVNKVLDEPRKDDLLALYQRYNRNAPPAVAAEPSAAPPPGFKVHTVSDELWQQGEDAIKILVGSILKELEAMGSES
ncbi:hypothetical protein V8C26DRAFT_420219 [Trichoderma gracile]